MKSLNDSVGLCSGAQVPRWFHQMGRRDFCNFDTPLIRFLCCFDASISVPPKGALAMFKVQLVQCVRFLTN